MQMQLLFIFGSSSGEKIDYEALVILYHFRGLLLIRLLSSKAVLSLIQEINCLLKWLICSWMNCIKTEIMTSIKKLHLARWNKINPHLYVTRWKTYMLHSNLIWMSACIQQDWYFNLCSWSPIEFELFIGSEVKLKNILKGINLVHISLLSFIIIFLC